MAGARVELQGNTLVVVGPSGWRRVTGITVSADDTIAILTGKVRRAINVGIGGAPEADAAAFERLGARGIASGIHGQLHPGAREETGGGTAPRTTPRSRPPRSRPPRERTPAARPPTPPPREAPRPTISAQWIETQLRHSRGSDRASTGAASALHTNSRYVEQFLTTGERAGSAAGTPNQRATTVSVFNELLQIPRFRLYLSSQAGTNADFTRLQSAITASSGTIAADASDPVIRAANFYIRYYLMHFEARPNGGNTRFRQEISQLLTNQDTEHGRLAHVDLVRTPEQDADREEVRLVFQRAYLSSPIDADTVTSSSLYMRRWYQEHPARGRGRAQSRIATWQAPEVLEIPGAQPAETTRVAEAQTGLDMSRYAAALANPNVLIVGASLTEGGAIGRELQRLLRRDAPSARVESDGVSGEAMSGVLRRYNGHRIGGRGRPNIVVISGAVIVNDGRSLETVQANLETMIARAHSAGVLPVVWGSPPYATYPTWSAGAQRRADAIDAWLRQRTDIIFVDLSSLGTGTPATLRPEYDGGDHLHPNLRGRNEIGRMIQQAVWQRAVTRTAQPAQPQRTPLEEHAHRHWQNLQVELFRAVQTGRPEGIVSILRLPTDVASTVPGSATTPVFERALRHLNRDDLPRAFDRVFNELFHDTSTPVGRAFHAWASGQTRYQPVTRPSVRLSETTPAGDRRIMIEAMVAFVNHVAGLTGETNQRLAEDLRILNRQVFPGTTDTLTADGRESAQALTALAVYSWRQRNRTRPAGHWARGIEGITLEEQQAPAQTAPVQPERGQQRRVLRGL
ncbi:SGNH/GDSL hydrolase family protein [Candidatus Micrarchaeota archaeon]|nr:SGNH/GDSL hydrolase family protein [Candidatus Micrarchaeota archaeon]